MKSRGLRPLDFIRIILSSSSSPDFSPKNVRICDKYVSIWCHGGDHSKWSNFFPGPCSLKMTGRTAPTLILSEFFCWELPLKHDRNHPGGNYYSGLRQIPFSILFHLLLFVGFSSPGLISWPTGPRDTKKKNVGFLEQWLRKVCNLIATSVQHEILGSEVFIVDQWFWRGSNLIWHIVSICWISWCTTWMLYANFTRFCDEFPGVQHSNESWNSTRQKK